jgi:DNA-binding winged helix-turn-helix (wHTH) protein
MLIGYVSTNLEVFNRIRNQLQASHRCSLHAAEMQDLSKWVRAGISPQYVLWHAQDLTEENVRICQSICELIPQICFFWLVENQALAEKAAQMLQGEVILLAPNGPFTVLHERLSPLSQSQRNEVKQASRESIPIGPGIVFKPDLQCLVNDGAVYPLPGKELELFRFLFERKGQFVTTEQIQSALWDEYTSSDLIRQYIYRLRKKLHNDRVPTSVLLHAKGMGYMLVREFDPVTLQFAHLYATVTKHSKPRKLKRFSLNLG